MKQLLVIALALITTSAAAQNKSLPKPAADSTVWTTVTFTVDSTNWEQWYYILNAGTNNLLKTTMPANKLETTTIYGNMLLQRVVEMYNKKYPKKP